MTDATTPVTTALQSKSIAFRLLGREETREADEAPEEDDPYLSIACYYIYREERQPVFVLTNAYATMDRNKAADAVEGTITSIKKRGLKALTTVLTTQRPRGEPSRVIMDTKVMDVDKYIRIPSGTEGHSVRITSYDLMKALEAALWDVSNVPVWETIEPYFAVTYDGVRSLDPHRRFFMSATHIYIDDVQQRHRSGEPEDYVRCLDQALTAARRLHPRPDDAHLAAARFKYLKEG